MNYLDKTGLTYVWSKLKPLFNAKQDTLVSGTNIKTINNTSVLGNGNINIIDAIYPVGSIYMSVNSTSPATLFGGTWTQIKDTFLLSAGDTYTAGDTGGEATHTLTSGEMPIHNHTFTGEAHSHGLNSHTHTYDKVKSPTGAATGNTGSTTLTVNQIPAHNHTQYLDYGASSFPQAVGGGTQGSGNNVTHSSGTAKTTQTVTVQTANTGGGQGHTHTLNNHTHTTSTESKNTGAATGNTANATQGGTIGNAGSGNAHNNMPPYLAVYVWKRTA